MGNRWVKGVTLIELMITVAIIGVIAAIAVPTYTDYIETAKLGAMRTNMNNIVFLMDSYERDEGGYPQTAGVFLQDAALLTELGWAPSSSDQSTYAVVVASTGYVVTVTHADGTEVTH
ncbi:MAG: type IV pilus assembly protein PilE [Candidatus Azotimanducaceae bacterium]|jgi:type IV pilus assembly protein PilE